MKITLCIPMYNESHVIEKTVATLDKYMNASFGDYEVLIINDGSTDDCAKIAAETAEKLGNDRIKVIGYEKNQGKGAAIRYGMLRSTGDFVLFTDSDLAYGCDVIGAAAERFAKENPDLLIGSRNISKDGYEGYTLLRKIASKTYIKVLCVAAGFRLSDSQCGFKGFSGEAAHKIFSYCEVNRFAFDFEMLMIAKKIGYKISEMPVKVINHGESKVRVLHDTFQMLSDLRRIKKRVKRLEIK